MQLKSLVIFYVFTIFLIELTTAFLLAPLPTSQEEYAEQMRAIEMLLQSKLLRQSVKTESAEEPINDENINISSLRYKFASLDFLN